MGTTTRTVRIPETVSPVVLLGPVDEILRTIEDGFPSLTFVVRGRIIEILSHSSADEATAMQARDFLHRLIGAAAQGKALDAQETRRVLETRDEAFGQPARSSSLSAGSRDSDEDHSFDAEDSPQDTAAGPADGFHVPYRAARRSYFSTSVRADRDRRRARRPLDAQERRAEPQPARHDSIQQGQSQQHRSRLHEEADRTRVEHETLERDYADGPQAIVISQGQPVRPKTAGQRRYVQAIDRSIITFGIGPAGTGKTYLAVAKAVQAFETRRVRRIILTRPAVEAGENLGFLPGTLNDKIDPYLRPLYDALSDMLGPQQLHQEMEDGSIEVAPLAYMRGRTLNDAFVILDEAQNTTEQQMKMFLTRLGFNTRMVVTGDSTQVDLAVRRSGLRTIEQILGGIDQISFVHLGAQDVVRHELVGRIVNAYNRHDEKMQQLCEKRSALRKGRDQK